MACFGVSTLFPSATLPNIIQGRVDNPHEGCLCGLCAESYLDYALRIDHIWGRTGFDRIGEV
jgi:hypothetical protein